jgi:UDP-N-acetylmuramoyl-tripeptide--D-alanyl-D-alanine ligase
MELQDLSNYRWNRAVVDSRLVTKGDLFFALPGAKVDGHDFLEEVALSGAIAAVVSAEYKGAAPLPLVAVTSPLQALQQLAKQKVASSGVRVIAVTGSVGKTTTKEFIAHLLGGSFNISKAPGNSNSQIGVPLAILNHLTVGSEFLILELGMTHPGQISRLVEIAPPEIAILTAVELVHAENFESLDQIYRAKAEIFSQPHTRLAVVHQAVASYIERLGGIAIDAYLYGCEGQSPDYGISFRSDGLELLHKGKAVGAISTWAIPGSHNVDNLLAAVAVAHTLGVPWKDIVQRAESLRLPPQRLEMVVKEGICFVDDSYNASMTSMKAALGAMPQPCGGRGRRVAVLGEMLELGVFAEACHREVLIYASLRVDKLFCLGAIWHRVREAVPSIDTVGTIEFFVDREVLAAQLKAYAAAGDVVLLKGSRSNGLEKVLGHFAV